MTLSIDLSGRRALVTGVTSGIGAGIAEQLANAGCDVAGCGRRDEASQGARSFLGAVRDHGRQAIYESCDIAEAEAPARFVARAAEAWGGLDIVVSNAGRNVFRSAEDCTESDWQECMQLDLASHWRLSKAAKPHLSGNPSCSGVIVLIGSNHAWSTMPGCFPYNVAKAGLNAMVQSLAIEWGPKIRSVGIAPGFIDTDGNNTWFNSFPDPAAERARTEASHPVGRIGRVNEVGALCVYLASPHAGFISGSTLLIDGGRSALMQDA